MNRYALAVSSLLAGTALLAGCSDTRTSEGAASGAASISASLAITSSLTLSATRVAAGETIDATVTYTNDTASTVSLGAVVIAARPPGGSHAGGPYDDFSPSAPATTLGPGQALTVHASRTFTAADPRGAWDVYPTYRDESGWHDGPDSSFSVGDATFAISSALALSASTAVAGQTVSGTVVYTNQTAEPVVVRGAVIAARPPGGSHTGGPYDDFLPVTPATTVAPGDSLTVSASRTFSASDPEGAWDLYATYQDGAGVWHDGPDQTLTMGSAPPPPPSGNFRTANGTIFDPTGNVWVGKGINIYDVLLSSVSTSADVTPLLSAFPGLKIVRIPCYSYEDPSYFQTFIQQLTAKGIVVELENHIGPEGQAGGGGVYTGAGLAAEANWYARLAAAYADNPYVWFGTLNEPSGPWSDIEAEHVAIYNAIRAAGSKNVVMLMQLGGFSSDGLNPASYAGMTNVAWDTHFYPWVAGKVADVGANAAALARQVANAQSIRSADGVVPVVIGEYGNSTLGPTIDNGGAECVQAVGESGRPSMAWTWGPGESYGSDSLTDASGNLTPFGAQVASFIAAR